MEIQEWKNSVVQKLQTHALAWKESQEEYRSAIFTAMIIVNDFPIPESTFPDPLASIAESLVKLSHPWVTLNSESEKFFRHLNNGEVELLQLPRYEGQMHKWGYRVVVKKEGTE